MPKIVPPKPAESTCAQVATQAELAAALKSGACVHVRADAEPSVLQWQRDNAVEPEIAGDWGPAT